MPSFTKYAANRGVKLFTNRLVQFILRWIGDNRVIEVKQNYPLNEANIKRRIVDF